MTKDVQKRIIENIVTHTMDLEFDLPSKKMTIKSEFNGKKYTDYVFYSPEGNHQFFLNNCFNFVEYKMIQKGIDITDITKTIKEDFIKLIKDILESMAHLDKMVKKPLTKWKNQSGIIVYDNVAILGDPIGKETFLNSGFPCLGMLSQEEIDDIEDVFIGRGVTISRKDGTGIHMNFGIGG